MSCLTKNSQYSYYYMWKACHNELQLPSDTTAEDIASSLQDLGFSIISVKQMTSSRPSAEAGHKLGQPPSLPYHTGQDRKVKGNLQTYQHLSHRSEGGSLQSPEWLNAVLQLPKIWPCLGELSAATTMLVVRRRPHA
jgi:hypothetical protein